MKQFFSLLLVIALCLGLCGCGDEPLSNIPAIISPDGNVQNSTEGTRLPSDGIESTEDTVPPTEPAPTEPTVVIEPVTEENIANYRYTITPVGTFANIDRLAFSRDFPVVRETKNGQNFDYLYSYTGELLITEPCQNFEHFGNGITAMYNKNGDDTSVRIVNVYTGDILFEDSTIVQIDQLSDRYYYMIHSAGHGMVYDMQLRKFIHDLMITDTSSLAVPFAIDSTLFVRTAHKCYDLYMDDGSIQKIENAEITDTGYLQSDGEDILVFDSKCSQLARISQARALTDYTASANIRSDRYFQTGEYQAYSVVNLAGQVVVQGPYKDVRIYGDYIVAGNADTGLAIFLGDGTQLTDFIYDVRYGDKEFPIIYLSEPGASKPQFAYIAGRGVVSVEGYTVSTYSYYAGENYKERDYYILTTSQSIHLTSPSDTFRPFLMESDQGIVDLIHGQLILPAGFDFAAATGEHLYIHSQGQWTVYTLELTNTNG